MCKYPYIQFYPADWIADTRILSLPARAVWLELILAMHQRGRTGTLTGTTERLAGLCGCSVPELTAALDELIATGTADMKRCSNGIVTVICRRLKNEETERENIKNRVRDFRAKRNSNAGCNANVTPHSTEYRVQNNMTDTKVSFSPEPENSGSPGTTTRTAKIPAITFDYEGDCRVHGLTEEQLTLWREAFPAIDVDAEIKVAAAWLDANRKNRKKEIKRFLTNWLSRTQERARRVPGERKQKNAINRNNYNGTGYDPADDGSNI